MHELPEILLQARRFRVERRSHTTPDGVRHEREIVVHPGAVVIVPLLPDGHICLIRNYRVAVDETLVELPAGTLEPSEVPAVAAGRELAEETGYVAGSIAKLCEFFMSPGILNERMHVYLATELVEGPAALEPGEQIEVFPTSLDTALAMIERGEIRDAKSIAALLFFQRFAQSPG